MCIDLACVSLAARLGDPEVFVIRHDGTAIVVDVFYIYRVADVMAVLDENRMWKGYPVTTGRKSCW